MSQTLTKTSTVRTHFATLTSHLGSRQKITGHLKRLPIVHTLLFRRAMKRAYRRFISAYPMWVAAFFDAHFLNRQAISLAKQYQAKGILPSAQALAIAWDAQIGPVPVDIQQRRIADLTPAVEDFIKWLGQELS